MSEGQTNIISKGGGWAWCEGRSKMHVLIGQVWVKVGGEWGSERFYIGEEDEDDVVGRRTFGT